MVGVATLFLGRIRRLEAALDSKALPEAGIPETLEDVSRLRTEVDELAARLEFQERLLEASGSLDPGQARPTPGMRREGLPKGGRPNPGRE